MKQAIPGINIDIIEYHNNLQMVRFLQNLKE